RRIGVLHLEPIGRPAGAVGRVVPLGDNAFEAKLAGMAPFATRDRAAHGAPLHVLRRRQSPPGAKHGLAERSMCSLSRMPASALARIISSVAFRLPSVTRLKSSPFSSLRSKAYRKMLSSWWR